MASILTVSMIVTGIILVLKKPVWSIVAILGMLYFPIFEVFSIGPVEISVSTLPVLLLFIRALWEFGRGKPSAQIAAWQWLVIVGMIASAICSTLISPFPTLAWTRFPNLVLYVMILFSVLIFVRQHNDLVLIGRYIVVFILVDLIVPGLRPLQQLLGTNALGINGLVFKYYPAFAICAMTLTGSFMSRSKGWRLAGLAVLILIIYRVIDFEARSAWLTLTLLTGLLAVRISIRRSIILAMISIAGLLVATLFFRNVIEANWQETSLALQALRNDDPSLASDDDHIRLIARDIGVRLFWQRPILGWGPNTFTEMILQTFLGPERYVTGGAFNAWLMLAVENGIFGVIPNLVAFIMPFLIIWFHFKRLPEDIRHLALALTLGALGTGFHLLFIDLMQTSQVWLHVGLAMAIAGLSFRQMEVPESSGIRPSLNTIRPIARNIATNHAWVKNEPR
jgi:hypothetical protein